LGIDRSHVAVHNWVHSADLQPVSTVSANQLAVDEKTIRLHGQQFWLYGAVDPHTSEIVAVSRFPTTNRVTTRWFLDEDGYDYEHVPRGNRNAIERVFWEGERRTSSFANSFSNVALATAESGLEAVAVCHNARQS